MKILGIESASLVASVALCDEEKLIAEYTVDYKKTHSQTLLPMLAELGRMTEQDFHDVDAVAVAAGPGSFTGLRIGAATAKGLGLAWRKPLVAVPTLAAMAYGLAGCGSLVCPIMDAKRGQVYTALYRFEADGRMTEAEPAAARDMKEMIAVLRGYGSPVVFLGDGVPVFGDVIRTLMGPQARFAPPHLSRQRAASVAALGLELFKQGRTVEAGAFAPEYYRVSQAERERSARLAGEGTSC